MNWQRLRQAAELDGANSLPAMSKRQEHALAVQWRTPPPRTVLTPLLDIHTHISRSQVGELVEAARLYGIRKLLGIAALDDGLRQRDRFPEELILATTLLWEHRTNPAQFAADNLALLARAATHDVRVVKLWFAPRIYTRFDGLHLDAPLLDPVFDAIAEHGLRVLVHVADPDRWFETKYTDVAIFGAKADQYPQLERRLAQYPATQFLAAHMGGHPESLDHLGQLLDRYANLSLDTSGTRWMIRELGRQREAVPTFLARYSDRIIFGTDQVVLDEPDPDRYTVRYWIHQMFWETDHLGELPIDDPDAEGTPVLRGLAVPAPVLERVYWQNALRWLELSP